ncbi:MAG: hypothetical protein ACM3N0_10550 [Chloroflexota bacterium]
MTAQANPKTKAKAAESSAEGGVIERGGELSEQVFEQIRDAQESAIEAVRGFMESVDEALPGESPSRRQDVVDSALRMSEKLVRTQYDFLTNVVRGASEALGAGEKE